MEPEQFLSKPENITFCLNTDGVAVFKSLPFRPSLNTCIMVQENIEAIKQFLSYCFNRILLLPRPGPEILDSTLSNACHRQSRYRMETIEQHTNDNKQRTSMTFF